MKIKLKNKIKNASKWKMLKGWWRWFKSAKLWYVTWFFQKLSVHLWEYCCVSKRILKAFHVLNLAHNEKYEKCTQKVGCKPFVAYLWKISSYICSLPWKMFAGNLVLLPQQKAYLCLHFFEWKIVPLWRWCAGII